MNNPASCNISLLNSAHLRRLTGFLEDHRDDLARRQGGRIGHVPSLAQRLVVLAQHSLLWAALF